MNDLPPGPIVVIDTETTGIHPGVSRIIEIAAVRLTPTLEIADSWSTLVRPGLQWIGGYVAHHLTVDDLSGAPSYLEVHGHLTELIRDAVVCGHNVAFDIAMLAGEARAAGLTLPARPLLDTRDLSRQLLPGLRRHRLQDVCRELQVPHHDQHRALGDATATALAVKELLLRRDQANTGQLPSGDTLSAYRARQAARMQPTAPREAR